MDNNLISILVIVLIVAILILIATLAYFGHRFLKLREQEAANKITNTNSLDQSEMKIEPKVRKKEISPEMLKSLRANKEQAESSLYCTDHPEEFSNGKCAISGESYCAHCLTKQGDVRISRKYLDLYLDNEWEQIKMFECDEENLELKKRVLKIKKELWMDENLPIIIQEHFKINVEDDEIEEYTVILSRQQDKEYISKELSFIK